MEVAVAEVAEDDRPRSGDRTLPPRPRSRRRTGPGPRAARPTSNLTGIPAVADRGRCGTRAAPAAVRGPCCRRRRSRGRLPAPASSRASASSSSGSWPAAHSSSTATGVSSIGASRLRYSSVSDIPSASISSQSSNEGQARAQRGGQLGGLLDRVQADQRRRRARRGAGCSDQRTAVTIRRASPRSRSAAPPGHSRRCP